MVLIHTLNMLHYTYLSDAFLSLLTGIATSVQRGRPLCHGPRQTLKMKNGRAFSTHHKVDL